MKNNPFTKQNFESVWLKHFKPSSTPIQFRSIKHTKFYKDKRFPLFVNVGKNITNGLYYEIDSKETDFKGQTFLIYDVPEYFNVKYPNGNGLKLRKARQYKGFSAELYDFESFNDYFCFKYKSKSRYKFRNRIKRLEACFEINYKVFYGDINREEYNRIFGHLIRMIKKRFHSLGLHNNIVAKKEYYFDLIYKMILDREAAIAVVYDKSTPIGISVSFVSDNILFFAITTFDTDYIKFSVGHILIMKLMDWSIKNGLNIFDFSKGEYDYKTSWMNRSYNYECHILYDSKSLKSILTAFITQNYFKFKQFLRDKKVNYLYSKLKFLFTKHAKDKKSKEFILNPVESPLVPLNKLVSIDLYSEDYMHLKTAFINFLYNNPKPLANLEFYKNSEKSEEYYVIGKDIKLHISTKN